MFFQCLWPLHAEGLQAHQVLVVVAYKKTISFILCCQVFLESTCAAHKAVLPAGDYPGTQARRAGLRPKWDFLYYLVLDRKLPFSVKNSKLARQRWVKSTKYETMTEIKSVPMTKTLNFQWVRLDHCNFSINCGECIYMRIFWIPAFAGMTTTGPISHCPSFPRRRESRS